MCMMAHALSLQVVKATNVVVMNCAEIEIQLAKYSQGGLGELGSTGLSGTGGHTHLDWADSLALTACFTYMCDGTYSVILRIVKAGCHPVAIAQVVEH